jgi:hypothetical protein
VSRSGVAGPNTAATLTTPQTAPADTGDSPDFAALGTLVANPAAGVDCNKLTKEQRTEAVEKSFLDSVTAMQNSEDFKAALDFAAKLHSYLMVNDKIKGDVLFIDASGQLGSAKEQVAQVISLDASNGLNWLLLYPYGTMENYALNLASMKAAIWRNTVGNENGAKNSLFISDCLTK